MYATGSREELYALTKQLTANIKVARALHSDGRFEAVEDMLEFLDLFTAMLQEALNDHFNGKN